MEGIVKLCIGAVFLAVVFVPHFIKIFLIIATVTVSIGLLFVIARYIIKRSDKQYEQVMDLPSASNTSEKITHPKNLEESIAESVKKAGKEIGTHFSKEDYARIETANQNTAETKRYAITKSLITTGEGEFYSVLLRAVPELKIMPKLRVADVIPHTTGNKWDFRRISQFHFDFVICDPRDPIKLKPLLAIELDDSSHRHWRNKKNDETKNKAAEEAGFPLLRFPWAHSYNEEEIRDKISAIINGIADKEEAAASLKNT